MLDCLAAKVKSQQTQTQLKDLVNVYMHIQFEVQLIPVMLFSILWQILKCWQTDRHMDIICT